MDILVGRIPDTSVDDLVILDGDWAIGDSTEQEAYLLVRLHRGNVKQYPLVGFGEERLTNGVIDGSVRKEIQEQLEADGIRVRQIRLTDGVLDIEF